MAFSYTAITQPGFFLQQSAPPLMPKPGKDNIRLRKIIKKTAKRKASAQTSQSAAPFRSSLSPVNEASPDLEHSDHSTPPKTPETPSSFYSIHQPQRISIRPLYQHVASPYPQRAAYGKAARFSPQAVEIPSYSYSQQVTTVSSYSALAHHTGASPAPGPVAQQVAPKISLSAETHTGLRPDAPVTTPQPKPTSLGLTPYPLAGGRAVIVPLTVLTPLVKPKSPRPTFKATEPSRSPKTMFDVPQISMYTATTSYYETSRTPPVYDTTALTSVGSTVPQIKIPVETKQGLTPESEVRRGIKPMAQPPLLGTDIQRKTPTSEIKRAEISTIITQTPESKSTTPTSEIKRATPTSEIRVKTPTSELQTSRISVGRPKTPVYHVPRVKTPVFEISRPNPLLFAVSPITVEPEKSKTPQTVSAVSSLATSESMVTAEPKPTETILNGDIHLDMTPSAKPIQPGMATSKSESDLTREKIPPAPADPQTPIVEGAVTSYGFQRPKTPTYEASRLMSASPHYTRPKTPTGVSPVAFQRPITPTLVAQKTKSTYRGLMPAEYAAYGGIRTYSPAFGISSSMTTTQEEVTVKQEELADYEAPSREPSVTAETPKNLRDEKASATASVPIIVVSQASDTLRSTLAQEASRAPSQVMAKQETMVIQETPKAKPPTAEVTHQKVETPVQEIIKPQTKTPGAKLPKSPDQDPLKAVRRLLGKSTVQTVEQNAEASKQKEPVKPGAEGAKPSSAEDKGKDRKADQEVGDKSLQGAEPLLKALQKPKGIKAKVSGWSRLKKHMVEEQDEPRFPMNGSEKEARGQDQSTAEKAGAQDENQTKDNAKATKMWDAVLFQMFSTKENIIHQIELNQSEKEKKAEIKDVKEIPSFVYRLPLLLFSPRFNAKKLKAAASRPVPKISTVFEMGLIGRKDKEEEPKDFNRTAKGFTAT
uniref:mucin-5AC n=1 Tax=Monopterus albus TaxID=43700 RepID=UPI0009B43164|nr:mucin-5AC-like [Monopterus albus]